MKAKAIWRESVRGGGDGWLVTLMRRKRRAPKGVLPETVGLSVQEKGAHSRTLAGQLWYPF